MRVEGHGFLGLGRNVGTSWTSHQGYRIALCTDRRTSRSAARKRIVPYCTAPTPTAIRSTEPSEAAVSDPVKKGAWNRGLEMEDEVKHKISQALKGRVPWNKGQKMSAETRERIRLGRLGRRHTLATRRKMSVSHTGMTHSAETMKALSQSLTGRKMSEAHRKKISASQKRRHAANRALKAIEEAHKTTGTLYGESPQHPSAALTVYLHQPIDRKRHSREKKTRAEVLKMYKTILREYRRLRGELSPWMKAFELKNGWQPCLADVEATQIRWLLTNFKQYLLTRDKLLRDIPYLRSAMGSAPTPSTPGLDILGDADVHSSYSVESRRKMERMETVASSPLSSDRVKNAMTAAMRYKKRQTAPLAKPSTPGIHGDSKQISDVQAKAIEALETLQQAQDDYVHVNSG